MWAKNTVYGQSSQPVFTSEMHPDYSFDKIQHLNALLNEMFDEIKRLYLPDDSMNMPVIHQILVHMKGCLACKTVLQPFIAIGRELQKRLPFFEPRAVELQEFLVIGEKDQQVKIMGGKLFQLFQMKGVPFVLQDFTAHKKKFGSNFRHIIDQTPLQVSWDTTWMPFQFVAKTWDIENKFINQSIDNYKFQM
jgi:hypothetical protein